MNQTFPQYLDALVAEKPLDTEQRFEVEGPSGTNSIPLGCVIEALKQAPRHEQEAVRTMLVRIDFVNADVCDYFEHLAGALAQ